MSLLIFVTLATFVTLSVAQDLTVNTPTSVQECLPVSLSWTGGASPVYVSLIPGGQPGQPIIKDFGSQTGNTLTWNVDQPKGTVLTLQIRDSTGKLNYSDKFTVQESNSCPPGGKPASSPAGSNPPPTSGGSNSSAALGGNTTKNSSSPAGASNSAPSGSGSTPAGSPAAGNTNTAATTGASPAGKAGSSDASRTIPGFAVMALAGVAAIFA